MLTEEESTKLEVRLSLGGHYLFRECLNLATFAILEDGHNPDLLNEEQYRELPTGCFCSTGLKELELPRDFHVLGAHACDSCKLLTQVNISNTSIAEIREFTFVHCVRLRDVRLPYTVHTIHVKAFMNCAALPGLAHPHCTTSPAEHSSTVLRYSKGSLNYQAKRPRGGERMLKKMPSHSVQLT